MAGAPPQRPGSASIDAQVSGGGDGEGVLDLEHMVWAGAGAVEVQGRMDELRAAGGRLSSAVAPPVTYPR